MVDLEKVAENLVEISDAKLERMKNLYTLTVAQTSAIEEEDIDKLNELIDMKQKEIDGITHLDGQFELIVSDIKTVYDIKSLDELETKCYGFITLKESIETVVDWLKKVINLEKSNSSELTKKKDALEIKIKHAGSGKKAIAQYGGASNNPAIFFDKKIK